MTSPTVLLMGSGEYTANVVELDRFLIEDCSIHTVAAIPLAAGAEHDAVKWITRAQEHYTALDCSVVGIEVFNRENAMDTKWATLLAGCDLIYFSGGNPQYLFDALTSTPLIAAVLERIADGAVLAGSSAGAMVLGSVVADFKSFLNPVSKSLHWHHVFGAVNAVIFPHFNHIGVDRIVARFMNNLPPSGSDRWIGIDEDTGILVRDGTATVVGPGTVYIHEEGMLTSHIAQSTFPLAWDPSVLAT